MKKRVFWYGVCGFSLIGCIICALILFGYYEMERNAVQTYEEIRNAVKETVSFFRPITVYAEEIECSFTEPLLGKEDKYLTVEIDFDKLQEMNHDIYAWITLPGTAIDYPVLQPEKDKEEFYLEHDAYGKESAAGAIYSEGYNGKDFTDFHTVLYGHDMKDSSMFGSLLLFEEKGVLERNKIVYIYLRDQILKYEIFGAYVSDSEHLLKDFDQEERLDRLAYLAEVDYLHGEEETFDRELFETVTEESHILTLSTCYHGDHSKRYLVQAVLIGRER